jgi:hypothetical protein
VARYQLGLGRLYCCAGSRDRARDHLTIERAMGCSRTGAIRKRALRTDAAVRSGILSSEGNTAVTGASRSGDGEPACSVASALAIQGSWFHGRYEQ